VRKGIANLPLHRGRAPRWLFSRMVKLARAMAEAMLEEFPPEEFLRRLSHPGWFQALGCVLGFDWHSSGLTTTTTAALKEALAEISTPLIMAAGGKGATARRTPEEVESLAERFAFDPQPIIRASRITAKVDSVLLQDGYSIYHHTIFFTPDKKWAVIQQGMKEELRLARRYHYLSWEAEDLTREPHTGISSMRRENLVLDLTSRKSAENTELVVQLSRENPGKITREFTRILNMPRRHALVSSDMKPKNLLRAMAKTYERAPEDLLQLLTIKGIGAKFVRALSLVADIVYGAPPSYEDPALYSFAHGGKDRIPYPVDFEVYEKTIEVLERAIKSSKLGDRDKLKALRRLSREFSPGA